MLYHFSPLLGLTELSTLFVNTTWYKYDSIIYKQLTRLIKFLEPR